MASATVREKTAMGRLIGSRPRAAGGRPAAGPAVTVTAVTGTAPGAQVDG